MYLGALEITDVNDWALGGALGGFAFAAILRLRGTKHVVGGWRRYVGAAAYGALAGGTVHDILENYRGRKNLEALGAIQKGK